jgi:DNA-3-methyladenine glycosylase
MQKLSRSFYTQRTLTVAKDLLGKIFVHRIGNKFISGMIVETEAYLFNDPASHSFRGVTERNKPMFNIGGFLYVYFTYGMHYCANVVTYKKGIGEAVLIRAVEPLDGIEIMHANRKFKDDHHLKGDGHLHKLTNGPAKFAKAFSLTKIHSGIDLCGNEIFITEGKIFPTSKIIRTTRIGISSAKDNKWRFYIKGNEWVSKK